MLDHQVSKVSKVELDPISSDLNADLSSSGHHIGSCDINNTSLANCFVSVNDVIKQEVITEDQQSNASTVCYGNLMELSGLSMPVMNFMNLCINVSLRQWSMQYITYNIHC